MKLSNLDKKVNTITSGQRFGHFLIDIFIIQVISYLVDIVPFIVYAELLKFLIFPLYYILFEFFYQWTPGKLITGTIVVDDFGNKPGIQSIILRTFIRFVPFEAFSCLDDKSYGWHDKWSKTYVIKTEELDRIKSEFGDINDKFDKVSNPKFRNINILIVAIICCAGISGYIMVKKLQEVLNFEHVVQSINDVNYDLIEGKWVSNWNIYKSLNFINSQQVIAVNHNNENIELDYSINMKTLIIKDNIGLELSYYIMNISEYEMILRDLTTMKENIIFHKEK